MRSSKKIFNLIMSLIISSLFIMSSIDGFARDDIAAQTILDCAPKSAAENEAWSDRVVCAFNSQMKKMETKALVNSMRTIFFLVIAYRIFQILLTQIPEQWARDFVDLAFKVAFVQLITFGAENPMESVTYKAYKEVECLGMNVVSGNEDCQSVSNSGMDVILGAYKNVYTRFTGFGDTDLYDSKAQKSPCSEALLYTVYLSSSMNPGTVPPPGKAACIEKIIDIWAATMGKDLAAEALKKVETLKLKMVDPGIGGMSRQSLEKLLKGNDMKTAGDKLDAWALAEAYDRILPKLAEVTQELTIEASTWDITASAKLVVLKTTRAIKGLSSSLVLFTPVGLVMEGPMIVATIFLMLSILVSSLMISYAYFMMVFVPTVVVPLGIVVYNLAWVMAPLKDQTKKLLDGAKTVLLPFALAPAVFMFFSQFVSVVIRGIVIAAEQVSSSFPVPLIMIMIGFLVAVTSFFAFRLLMKVREMTRDFITLNFTPLMDFAMDIAGFGKDLIAGVLKVAGLAVMGGALAGVMSKMGAGGGLMGRVMGAGGPGGPEGGGGGGSFLDSLRSRMGLARSGGGTSPNSPQGPTPYLPGGIAATADSLAAMSMARGSNQTPSAPQPSPNAQPYQAMNSPSGNLANAGEDKVGKLATAVEKFTSLGGEKALTNLKEEEASIRAALPGMKKDEAKEAYERLSKIEPQVANLEGAKAGVARAEVDLQSQKDFLTTAIAAGMAPTIAAINALIQQLGGPGIKATVDGTQATGANGNTAKTTGAEQGQKSDPAKTVVSPVNDEKTEAATQDQPDPAKTVVTPSTPKLVPPAPLDDGEKPEKVSKKGKLEESDASEEAPKTTAESAVDEMKKRREALAASANLIAAEKAANPGFMDKIKAAMAAQPEWARKGVSSIYDDLRDATVNGLKMTQGGGNGAELVGQIEGLGKNASTAISGMSASNRATAKINKEIEDMDGQIRLNEARNDVGRTHARGSETYAALTAPIKAMTSQPVERGEKDSLEEFQYKITQQKTMLETAISGVKAAMTGGTVEMQFAAEAAYQDTIKSVRRSFSDMADKVREAEKKEAATAPITATPVVQPANTQANTPAATTAANAATSGSTPSTGGDSAGVAENKEESEAQQEKTQKRPKKNKKKPK